MSRWADYWDDDSLYASVADPFALAHETPEARAAKEFEQEMGQTSLAMQQDWMDYIKREYAPYSEVAGEALSAQRGLAGLGEPGEQERMLADIEADPLYQAKVGAGEEAVLRGASATGGLRSGDASSALALQNQALLDQEIKGRYQQLAGLSGQGFMGQETMSGAGSSALGGVTGAMGALASGSAANRAAAQDKQSGLMGLVGGIVSAFSDERLKTKIRQIGEKNGLPWYKWLWNDIAGKKFGLRGEAVGFMASDVEMHFPECVSVKEGYRMVNYGGVS